MKKYRQFLVWALLVIVVQVAAGAYIYRAFPTNEDRATFGDMFGAVNTLFAGLAFAGVIYAIILQQNELELQRKELELTRKELERSAKAQESSESSLAEQVRISQQQLESVYRPYIVVRIISEGRGSTIWLTINNTGQIPASNLRLNIDKDVMARTKHGGEYNLAHTNAFTNEIPSFSPGSEINFILFSIFFIGDNELDESKIPLNFTITAAYNYPGASIEEQTIIDLRPYIDSTSRDNNNDRPFRELEKQLNDINKTLKNKLK